MVRLRNRLSRLGGQDGFTIIELGIVCVIIGILAVIGIPNYLKFTDRAKEALLKENMHVVQSGMEVFAVDNLGVYPTPAEEATLENAMPNHQFPNNPFTNNVTTIVWDANPDAPGEIAIIFVANGGYQIKGHGREDILNHIVRSGN